MCFQVNLNSAGIASGIELSTFALESGRVCVGSFDNFHIFHFLANGAPEELKKRLQIEDCSFAVSINWIYCCFWKNPFQRNFIIF